MEYITLNNGVKMPMAGIGTFSTYLGRSGGGLRKCAGFRLSSN